MHINESFINRVYKQEMSSFIRQNATAFFFILMSKESWYFALIGAFIENQNNEAAILNKP